MRPSREPLTPADRERAIQHCGATNLMVDASPLPARNAVNTSDPTNEGHSDNPTASNGRHKQTGQGQPLAVLPPLTVPLDGEHEQAAIDALAELLATWREHHYGESN